MVFFYMLKKVTQHQHQHHEKIYEALKQFNAAFLNEHNILYWVMARLVMRIMIKTRGDVLSEYL